MFSHFIRSCVQRGLRANNKFLSPISKRTKMDLAGKNVIITGASTGIGWEACKVLAMKKISGLGILDRVLKKECLEELAGTYPDMKLVFCKTDVSHFKQVKEGVKKVVEKFGGCLNVMINCAGVIYDKDPQLTVSVNLLGTMYGTLAGMCYMDKSLGKEGGQVCNVASVVGLEPCAPLVVYCSTKHGMIGWTRSMADPIIFDKTCVRHIAVCPGVTETPLFVDLSERVLFPYLAKPAEEFLSDRQPAKDCAENMIKAIENDQNGTIWICDESKLKELKPTKYWTLPKNSKKSNSC